MPSRFRSWGFLVLDGLLLSCALSTGCCRDPGHPSRCCGRFGVALDDCHCLGKPRRYGLLGTRPPPPTYLLPPTILNAACHTHERTGHTTLSRRGGCRPGRSCGVAHRPLLGINNIPAGLGIARNLSSPSLSPRYPIAQSTRRNGTPSKRSGPGGSVALPTRQLVIRRAGEPAPSGVLLLPDEALLPYSDGS